MFEKWVDSHKQQIIASTQELLRIPSVGTDPVSPDKPFGLETDRALQFMLALGEKHGFTVKNADGYAGHIELSGSEDSEDTDDYVAVLAHLDVVPAGNDWTYPPFAAEIHDGFLYARGAIDDKGPAMAVFYALLALKKSGLPIQRKIRLIFGLDEETDWRCMDHYFKTEPLPWGGFTPDADFPLIYAEKGIVSLELTKTREQGCDQKSVCALEVTGGERPNMVPDVCMATIQIDAGKQERFQEDLRMFCEKENITYTIHETKPGQLSLQVKGQAAHGSLPGLGVNAVQQMGKILAVFMDDERELWKLIGLIDPEGKAFGIDSRDQVTGALTCNLGIVQIDSARIRLVLDIRFPIDQTSDELIKLLQAKIQPYGFQVQILHDLKPLYVPKDSPVVMKLQQVYERLTGESAEPIAIGGGTYARAIPNAVAFGPVFPGMEDIAHQRDEKIAIDHLLQITNLYAHAIYELAK